MAAGAAPGVRRAAWLVVALLVAGCVTPGAVRPASTTTPTGDARFTATSVFPGDYSTKGPVAHVLVDGPLAIRTPDLVQLKAKADGADLQMAVIRPDTSEKVPVILLASPYFGGRVTPDAAVRTSYYPRLAANFVPKGYAVAFAPVRGTADDGSCSDLMGKLERSDIDQEVTWLAEQPWSNGNVGMVGQSYDGSTPWEAAGSGNPHVKTIVPISGVNDIYTLMYGGGVPEWRGPLVLNALYYEYGLDPTGGAPAPAVRSPQHRVEGVACPDAWQGLAVSVTAAASGERDPLGYWAERNSRPLVEKNYRGSIFIVHGLQDWNVDPHEDFPWVNTLEANHTMKFLMGQWMHQSPDSKSPGQRWDWAEILLHWFDRWLKEDATVDLGPRVQVQDDEKQWRNEDAWPPRDANDTRFFLAANGALGPTPGASGSVPITTRGNPSFHLQDQISDGTVVPLVENAQCMTCEATFATSALEAPMRIAGIPHVRLNVTTTAPAGMISAWLYAQDGSAMKRVGWGSVDVRFPRGGEVAQPPAPGSRVALDIALEPLDSSIPAGAKLVLVLHTDGDSDHPGLVPAPAMAEVGGAGAVLSLPTIDRDGSTFFSAPS